MSIDYNLILTRFINIARTGVGSSLSTSGFGVEERPSVMKARMDGNKPDYPYITVDVTAISDEDGWEINKGITNLDDVFTENIKHLLLTYRVYGGNSLNIANNLKGYIQHPFVREEIRTNLNGSLVEIFEAERMPVKLSHKFVDSASLNLIFNVADRTSIPGEDIQTVDIEPTYGSETEDNITVQL